MSKVKKIFTVLFTVLFILILLIISFATFEFNKTNTVMALPYSSGSWYTINALTTNPNLYCIDYGAQWWKGGYYCYSVSPVSAGMAFLVDHQSDSSRDPFYDEEAMAIWDYGNQYSTNPLVKEARQYDLLANGKVTIKGPTKLTPLIDDGSGNYGPFVVTYPVDNNQMLGTVTMKINDKEYTSIPNNGQSFYVSEADGVKYGEANTIQINWDGGTTYKGYAAYLTPAMRVGQSVICPECGYTRTRVIGMAAIADGQVIEASGYSWQWTEDYNGYPSSLIPNHKREVYYKMENGNYVIDENTGERIVDYIEECRYYEYEDPNSYYYDPYWDMSWSKGGAWHDVANYNDGYGSNQYGWQNLMYVGDISTFRATSRASISFWAGKPRIELELEKLNSKKENIGDATFSVSVSGGTIGDANGPTTGSIGGSGKITIVAPRTSNEVTVTLKETHAPEDYIKIDGDIVIKYTFNGSSWSASLVSAPQGEKIDLKPNGTIRTTTNCKDNTKLTVVDRPTIKIELDKKDTLGQGVPVSFDLSVTGAKVRDGASSMSGGSTAVIEPNIGATTVTVKLTEKEPGDKYIKYKTPITLTFTSDSEQSSWTLSSYTVPGAPEKVTVEGGENKATIKAINRRTIIVYVNKYDNGNPPNSIGGITFNAEVSGGNFKNGISSVTTDASGSAKFIIEPAGEGDVTLKIKETSSIYYDIAGTVEMKFVYQGGCWTEVNNDTSDRVGIGGSQFEFSLNIENIAKLENIVLTKVNKFFPDEAVPNVSFNVSYTNASGPSIVTTGASGSVGFGTILIDDPNQDVTITLKESGSATTLTGLNYKGLENATITITVKHRVEGCGLVVTGADSADLVTADYNVGTNTVSIEAQNEVTLNLSGKVWKDGQTGIKPVSSPNGLKDNGEEGVANVTVTADITADSSRPAAGVTTKATMVTNSNGTYTFIDLPASAQGKVKYYVMFTYDGVNYVATTPNQGNDETIDSDGIENSAIRTEFNNKFHTIIKDNAVGTNGQRTSLTYSHDDPKVAKLNTNNNNMTISAATVPVTYTINTSNIDLGLVRKGVDLAAVTDIQSATVTINGVEKTYDYNDISDLEKNEYNNPKISAFEADNVKYNLYLYESDYNYRIGDYQLPAAHRNELAVTANNATTNLQQRRENDGELDVKVTYQILLNNQSANEATINKIAYYYDTRYELAGATPELVNINNVIYNKVIIDVNKALTDTDNQELLQLVFNVDKDELENLRIGAMKNWVEIISYSTNNGCIDEDSAPDNLEQYSAEDDTDDAPVLDIKLNGLNRQITGYVFEDKKTTNNPGQYNTGNGLFDGNDEKIDDVIIQLIEIKNVTVGNTTLRLEYIWQETVSGSGKVTYVKSDGTSKGEYNVVVEPGCYVFNQNIIPGQYIVRFIYGDGTYWDTAKNTGNILKYNGQDYKSTIDSYYDKTVLVDTYATNASKARDNEARRLEEIAYAREISKSDVSKLIIDNKDELRDTWMCAETSLIWTDISKNSVEGDETETLHEIISFGLVERPRATLVLEKHITSLKIYGATGGIISEAVTDLNNYEMAEYNGLIVPLISVNGEGVTATTTSKEQNQRGEWIVQTQTDRVAGQNLEITYSYKVKNIGDLDYIGTKLDNEIAAGKTYSNIAAEVKQLSYQSGYQLGEYLGNAYYNGNTDGQVKAGIPFQIEDYMNTTNGLQVKNTSSFAVTSTDIAKPIWDYQILADDSRLAVNTTTEKVNVLQSKQVLNLHANDDMYGNSSQLQLQIYDNSLNATSGNDFIYRSYAAQLIYPTSGEKTSKTGTLSKGMTLGNLGEVQSYVGLNPATGGIPLVELTPGEDAFTPELDEYVAETLIITLDTGADKETPTKLIITITAGLAVVAVGIVLIKKFIIK